MLDAGLRCEACHLPSCCCSTQVLRSLGLMPDMEIDELENLAQRVEIAKHQVCRTLLSAIPAFEAVWLWQTRVVSNSALHSGCVCQQKGCGTPFQVVLYIQQQASSRYPVLLPQLLCP